jgi:hypothetical protein
MTSIIASQNLYESNKDQCQKYEKIRQKTGTS